MTYLRSLMSAAAVVALTACAGANTVNSAPSSQPVLSATTGEKQKDATTTTSVATSSVQTTSTTNAVTTTSEVASSTFGKAEITPRSFDRVSETIKNFVDQNQLNGAGFVVVDRNRGVIYHNHWGEFSADRISLIASTSKVISAGVLVHLHDKGILDLEAPIGDIIDYAGQLSSITPVQLLSGSSGIPGLQPDDPLYICMFLPSSSLQQCAAEALSIAASDPRTIAPDTEFRYGGIQLQVAGAVAEVASGKQWADLIDEIYVQPCEMRSLGYTNPWIPLQALTGDYPNWSGDLSLLPPTDNPHIGGGGYIATGDYGKLLSMHLNNGKCGHYEVLSQKSVALMQRNRSGEVYGSPIGYGLGWWTQSRNRYGESANQETQSTFRLTDPGLYGSTAWLQPEDGFGAYLVVESTGSVGQRLANILYPLVESAVKADRSD
mgnify:CR=1 FL=1|tara:strand:- start:39461 stop:40765 length:1305 start_codon:yes stop_codon:yes gene_type:complete